MTKQVTDNQKKKIIADYIDCQNYSAVARKYNLSPSGIEKIVNSDKDSVIKCEQKREQNTKDMISYMEEKKDKAFSFIDLAFDELCDKDKIRRTSIINLATAVGIIIDKYVGMKDNGPPQVGVKILTPKHLWINFIVSL